jgi:tetratricopeptide (TPR) repeat protein
VRREHGIEVQIRVGLNSGEVVVRAIGNDLHMDYSAIGQTTHLAARMEQLAPPGTIRQTAETLQLAEGLIQVTPLGPVPVKGLPAPVEVCELVGAGPARTRLQAFAARGLTPFVGRQAELEALRQALAQAGAGHGQMVAVIGEPGVGKTHLFHEFTHTSRTQGWLLLESSSTSYGKATSYLPVIDLLKAYVQIEDRDDGRRIREKLTGRLLTLDPALGPTLPAFLALLEVPVEDASWQALDPAQRRQRTLVETQVLVGNRGAYRLARAQPSIQVPATVQAVLAARIDRLPAEEKQLLHTAAVIGPEVPLALLQAVAEGPEETLRLGLTHLQAAEFLYETRLFPEHEYTFKHALTQQVAYETLLQERRRALHARIVEALEALAGERVAEQVERLAHHALRGEVWDKAVTFWQQAGARAHDCAAFHEAVAAFEQALQALEHLPEPVDTQRLALDLRLALYRPLMILGEHGRCLALLNEAEALARGHDDRARLGRVLASMARVLRITADHCSAIAAGQQALELAVALGESALQMQATHILGQAYQAIGDVSQAAELLRWNVEAADRASGTLSTDVRIESRAWLAWTLSVLGAFVEGRRHGEEALRLAMLEGRGDTPIIAHTGLGRLYLVHGDLELAIRVFDQGLALCRTSGHRTNLRQIVAGLGSAYMLQGRLAEARALLEEAISESIRTGGLSGLAHRVAWLSEVCRLAGRGEEAWQHAHQALDLARQQQARGDEALALHQLGTVHAHADPPDTEQAEAHYCQALTLANELGMRPLVAHCYLGLGTLYVKIGQQEPARAELTAAIELYRAMDMTFWLPQAEAALVQVEGR